MAIFNHIIVPTDFSETSQHALDIAIEIARESGGELTVMHTTEVPVYAYSDMAYAPVDLLSPIAKVAEERLRALVESVRQRHPGARGVLKVGVPWEQIMASVAEVQADLIVMGTHGRRGVAHALLGSVAEKVVRVSQVPVLTVRTALPASPTS